MKKPKILVLVDFILFLKDSRKSSFEACDLDGKTLIIDQNYVDEQLASVVADEILADLFYRVLHARNNNNLSYIDNASYLA